MNVLLLKVKHLLFGSSLVDNQLKRSDTKWVVNQGSAEIALGVDYHENNPRQENSHRLHLVAGIAAHLHCTHQSGTCYLPNLG